MDGWIKLHRCLIKKAIWKNHNLFRVFSWCLLKANWQEEYEEMVGMTKVVLNPGQFVFGRFKAAKELGLKPSTLVDCLKWLKTNTTIDIKSNNKFSVITVINWELYQSDEDEPDTKSDTKSDNTPTTSRQQADTNKNTKKSKKSKKEITKDEYDYFSDFWQEYPRKVAKPDAVKAFAKLKMNDELMELLMAGLFRAIESESWLKDGGKFIPYPATWLNGRRWEDGR